MTFKRWAVRGGTMARTHLQGALWAAVTRHTGERPRVVCAATPVTWVHGHAGHHCFFFLGTIVFWAPREQAWRIELGHSRVQVGRKWFPLHILLVQLADFYHFLSFTNAKKKKKGVGGSSMEQCQRDLSIPFSDKHPQIQASGELGTSAEGAECPDWSVDVGLL